MGWKRSFSFVWGIVFFLLLSASVDAWPSLPSLKENWNREFNDPQSGWTPELRAELAGRQIVFIDGILNEVSHWVGNYFTDNIKEAAALGMLPIHQRYSSAAPFSENGNRLAENLTQLYFAQSQKGAWKQGVTLWAHSMGAPVVLYALLKHPFLITNGIVDRVVFIQGAIGGSPLARNIVDSYIGSFLNWVLKKGLLSLDPPETKRILKGAFEYFQTYIQKQNPAESAAQIQERIREISRRIFYVPSYVPVETPLSLGLKILLYFCKERLPVDEPNDAVILTKGHTFRLESGEVFGEELDLLVADHIELVVSGTFSGSNALKRAAFTRALLQTIFHPEKAGNWTHPESTGNPLGGGVQTP